MKDRIPTKILKNGALRYGVYDDAGALLRYEYIKPEDEPTEAGTPLNKANLLSDNTAKLLEIKKENPTPSDAFEHIAKNTGGLTQNINLLEEAINMKYCKVLDTLKEPDEISAWLANGVVKYALKEDALDYTLLLKVPKNENTLYLKCLKNNGTINNLKIQLDSVPFPLSGVNVGANECRCFLHATSAGSRYVVIYMLSSIKSSVNSNARFSNDTRKIYIYDVTTNAVIQTLELHKNTDSAYFYDALAHYPLIVPRTPAYFNATYNAIYFLLVSYSNYSQSVYMYAFNISSKQSNVVISNTYGAYASFRFLSDSVFIWSCFTDNFEYVSSTMSIERRNLTAVSTSTAVTLASASPSSYAPTRTFWMRKNASNGAIDILLDGMLSNATNFFSGITAGTSTVTPTKNAYTDTVLMFTPNALYTFINLPNYSGIVTNNVSNISIRVPQVQLQGFYWTLTAGPSSSFSSSDWDNVITSTSFCNPQSLQSKVGIVDRYGNYKEIKIEVPQASVSTWTCPEDGTYKFILVGGGASGNGTVAGGSGYLKVITRLCALNEKVPYNIGVGGVYLVDTIEDSERLTLQEALPNISKTTLATDFAQGANGPVGGANGIPGRGGGGGGYDLVDYGGNGVGPSAVPYKNGGGDSVYASGYGAGGNTYGNGKDGCIVILR